MAIKRTITTTLPTALAEGEEIYYRDSNGVQTLWVGNASGVAWPSVGYKEYSAIVDFNNSTSTITQSVKVNTLSSANLAIALVDANGFSLASSAFATTNTVAFYSYGEPTDSLQPVFTRVTTGFVTAFADTTTHGESNAGITIRVYQ